MVAFIRGGDYFLSRGQIYAKLLPNGESVFYNLGPHPPRLWPDDVELVHHLWLELSQKQFGAKLHHRDVVRAALRRFEDQLNSPDAPEVIDQLRTEVERRAPNP